MELLEWFGLALSNDLLGGRVEILEVRLEGAVRHQPLERRPEGSETCTTLGCRLYVVECHLKVVVALRDGIELYSKTCHGSLSEIAMIIDSIDLGLTNLCKAIERITQEEVLHIEDLVAMMALVFELVDELVGLALEDAHMMLEIRGAEQIRRRVTLLLPLISIDVEDAIS